MANESSSSTTPKPASTSNTENSKVTGIVKARTHSYNPFDHRDVEQPNSNIRSLANLLKASLGTGILAMPLAFSNSGWLVGIIGTVIIAFICGHCVHIFVEVSRGCCKLDKKPQLGYAETCRSTFINGPHKMQRYGTAAFVVAELALLCTYLGCCCIYSVLISETIKQIFDQYVFKSSVPITYYCLVLIVPLALMVQIRHLKWLAPFSLLANVLLIVVFAICLYFIFRGALSISNKKMFGRLSRFPAYLSTVIFAMEGIGVVMPVENTMKTPEHFLGCPSILTIAMTLVMTMYIVLGLFGYLRYGDVLRGSITLNLPMDHWLAISAKISIAISIFFSYPLHFYVAHDTAFRFMQPFIQDKYVFVVEIFVRIIFVCITVGIGIALPMLEQIINIVGALFYSMLGLIIPGVVDLVFQWHDLGRCKWIFYKDIFLICFGFLAVVSGCIVTISDIIALL